MYLLAISFKTQSMDMEIMTCSKEKAAQYFLVLNGISCSQNTIHFKQNFLLIFF